MKRRRRRRRRRRSRKEKEKEKERKRKRRRRKRKRRRRRGGRKRGPHIQGKLWPHQRSSLLESGSHGHRSSWEGNRHSSQPHSSTHSDYMNLRMCLVISLTILYTKHQTHHVCTRGTCTRKTIVCLKSVIGRAKFAQMLARLPALVIMKSLLSTYTCQFLL